MESRLIVARAPVRVSFGGGGTDLEAYYGRFGGFVLSAAISRYAYVVASESADRGIHLTSGDYRTWESFPRGEIPAPGEALGLLKAAVGWAAERGLDDGIELFTASEIPPGTGLGSSSAMAVALITALSAYLGLDLDAGEIAHEASMLEIERLAMPIGKQDQYASAFGGLNTIEFTRHGCEVTPLPLLPDVMAAFSSRLLLFSTGQSHNSAQILRQQRTDTTVRPAVTQSLHRIKELAHEMCAALENQDLDGFGVLLDRAWEQKKRLSGKVSSQRIDACYAAAREAGALGGKIAGAGGGGFLLLYAPPEKREAVRAAMVRRGLEELCFDFDYRGAEVIARSVGARGRPAPDFPVRVLPPTVTARMGSLNRVIERPQSREEQRDAI
ncbi:MAG TPA: GHMP kinase [Chloroflexota bacterium]|nr:GHMP kinase [Chloroflexota bacterium]